MKKTVFRMISVILLILAVIAVVGVVTVEGSGFLDFSNIARMILSGIAIVCVGLSSAAWVTEDPRAKMGKRIFVIAAIILILAAACLAEAVRPPASEIIN